GEELLLARRAEGGLFGGLWELPSAEVPPGAPDDALGLALRALLGRSRKVGGVLGRVKRTLTHRDLVLDLVEVTGQGNPPPGGSVQEWRWASVDDAKSLGMSTAMARALALASDAPQTHRLSVPKRPRSRLSRDQPP
ncbi:MAG: NUDIX domain-containing protein, partial [Myxococcaceae bacterium]